MYSVLRVTIQPTEHWPPATNEIAATVFPGVTEVITVFLLHRLAGTKAQTLLLTSNTHSWLFSGVLSLKHIDYKISTKQSMI